MKKRALAAVLWSVSGWYVGAIVAWALNIGPVLPVVLAASASCAKKSAYRRKSAKSSSSSFVVTSRCLVEHKRPDK